MITLGLSQHEISLITKILDEHKVEYHVGVAGGGDEVKIRGGRGDASFYQIEIHDGQYNVLPASAKAKLEGLGIFPEMEAPDFSEEAPAAVVTADPLKSKQKMKNFERVFIVIMLALLVSFIMKVIREG